MAPKAATWKRGKQTIYGSREWLWSSQTFRIELESRDRITGVKRSVCVRGDKPEFNGWKLSHPAPSTEGEKR